MRTVNIRYKIEEDQYDLKTDVMNPEERDAVILNACVHLDKRICDNVYNPVIDSAIDRVKKELHIRIFETETDYGTHWGVTSNVRDERVVLGIMYKFIDLCKS